MGLLGNLLFGERNKYNATVDEILNDALRIQTDSRVNPNFAGVLAYLALIDEGWHHKVKPEDTAIHIGMTYFMGMVKSDVDIEREEAQELYPRLRQYIAFALSSRRITDARSDQFFKALDKYAHEYGLETNMQSPTVSEPDRPIETLSERDRLWKAAQEKVGGYENSVPVSPSGRARVGAPVNGGTSVAAPREDSSSDDDRARQIKQADAALERGDHQTAFGIFWPLAEMGDAEAQLNLGLMYENGDGVAPDLSEALTWYRKSAESGNTDAQYYLGVKHGLGLGIPLNYAEAIKWFSRSANQGYGPSQHMLGIMCAQGKGVTRDNVLAYKWLSLAATSFEEAGEEDVADVIDERNSVAALMTAEQISLAQKLIYEWKVAAESRAKF